MTGWASKRKWAVVILGLCWLAGSAGGAVSLSPPGGNIAVGDTVTIVVASDSLSSYEGYLEFETPFLGTVSPMEISPYAGTDAWADDLTDEGKPGWWHFGTVAPVGLGEHFTVEYHATTIDGGTVIFNLFDAGEARIDRVEISQDIPEPSSLIVFGLALAAMRRRWGCGRRSL